MKFSNEMPIYLQLSKVLALNIVNGKYKAGEKIPSVRDLANIYKVNPNTVQKALSELENLNLIYTERTNGKFVVKDYKVIKNYTIRLANEMTLSYLENMKKLGIEKKETLKFIERNE